MQMLLSFRDGNFIWARFCICVSITRCDWVNEEKAVTGKAKTYRFGESLSILRGDFLGKGAVNGNGKNICKSKQGQGETAPLPRSEQAGRLLDPHNNSLMKHPRNPPHLLIIPRILF